MIWEKRQGTPEPLRDKLNAAVKKEWEEWEIPREAEPKWSDTGRKLHADWWQGRTARQKEIDASIAAKAEPEYLFDKPYFLGPNDPYGTLKTTLKADIDEEAWSTLHSDTSRAFDKPRSGRIAVKVINHLGDEVMKVFRVG